MRKRSEDSRFKKRILKEKLTELRQILDVWIEKAGDQGGIPENPAEVEFYLEGMKQNYDKRIKARYKEENMSLELFK